MPYALSSTPTGVHFSPTESSPVRALLSASVDYAGLFPPAELPLQAALSNHAEYVRSKDAWMLGAFVLPMAKFSAAAPSFSQFDALRPLRISALGAKSENGGNFCDRLAGIAAAIRELQQSHRSGVSVAQLEIALPADADTVLVGELQNATRALGLRIYCEAPPDDAARVIALLAQINTAEHAPLGYKLRTGGITADAFPTCGQIACALVAATRDRVPIKFTAGLHHPIRQFRDEVNGKMHGFLNVLGAAVLAAEHGWNETTTADMLEDEDATSFRFDPDTFSWRDWKIDTNAIAGWRRFVTSFGSCSFDEPREDLRSLHLL